MIQTLRRFRRWLIPFYYYRLELYDVKPTPPAAKRAKKPATVETGNTVLRYKTANDLVSAFRMQLDDSELLNVLLTALSDVKLNDGVPVRLEAGTRYGLLYYVRY